VGVGVMAEDDRFVSSFTNRLDAKGRVSIPAPFRAVLARDGFEGLFVHPSLDTDAIDCGGHALLKEIDTLLETYPQYTDARDALSLALYGMSEKLKVDPEGRVQLSESCKARAGVTTEVTFVGMGHKFQIWEPGRFRAHQEEARNRARELRKYTGPGGAAGHTPPPHGARE
jgi:MraZ protein